MTGIFKNTFGQSFTGKVTNTKAEAIWWIYQQYKKSHPEVYRVIRGRYCKMQMNVVSFYKRELHSVGAIYYTKELEEI